MGGSYSDDLKLAYGIQFEVMFLIDMLRAILKVFGLFPFSPLSVLGDCELHRF